MTQINSRDLLQCLEFGEDFLNFHSFELLVPVRMAATETGEHVIVECVYEPHGLDYSVVSYITDDVNI